MVLIEGGTDVTARRLRSGLAPLLLLLTLAACGSSPAPTTTTSTTTTLPPRALGAIFPTTATSPFTTEGAAATAFALRLGFSPTAAAGAGQSAIGGSATVNVSGATTTISLAMANGTWWATGATSEQIQVTSPIAGAAVTSPLRVTGQAQAFEGQLPGLVIVNGRQVGRGLLHSGSTTLGPLAGSITFTAPAGTTGYLAVTDLSARDGSTVAAAAVRIECS